MKRSIICIYALVISLFLTACSGSGMIGDQANKQRNIRIGVSMNDVYDTFIVELSARLNEWAKEMERETGDVILLDIVSAGGSQLAQNDQITGFIDRGYDVVCVNLVDRTDATVIIDKAKSSSVPVVFFNREPVADDLNRWNKLYYVGANAEQSGMLQAELVINALSDKKRFEQIDRSVFTGSLAVVDQDIILFEDTISNNIKMWDDSIEDFEVILAARDAQIHDDIMQRRDGYQGKLIEGGKDLSGGQRQRLEIARVLAQDPSIIIMDEATSALDAKTEYELVKAVKDRGITCIVIAHRLSTIRDCDEIIVMDRGEVIERGKHDELYAKGGYYTELISND